MAELAGKGATIKVSGAATAFVGEATTGSANTTYQITDAAKQVLDRTATIRVHLFDANDTAEAGTTTTNITMVGHGLAVNDLIVNTTRSDAARLVATVPDVDNVTVAAVAGQTTGDTIAKYPTEATTAYTLARLNGTVTYGSAVARVIRISGDYLPMSTAAYAHEFSYNRGIDIHETPSFGDTHKYRLGGQKFASGTLSQWDVTDTYFADALTAEAPVVIEFLYASGKLDRVWALLESTEMQGAIDSPQDEIVTFISTEALLTEA